MQFLVLKLSGKNQVGLLSVHYGTEKFIEEKEGVL